MKQGIRIFLTLALAISFFSTGALAAQKPDNITSTTAVLMDVDTGEILYEKNMTKKMYPASITKILTGLLVVESCAPDEIATASTRAVKIQAGYVHIALEAGDTISVGDAMYAMMLASANDAANVLAEHVAESQKGFSSIMNRRAKELGATDSNFTNPSGFPDNKHYTTAYDMALITREACQNPNFMRYFGAASYVLPSFNKQTEETEIKNYQYMLLEDMDEYNPDVIGGKIGYTKQASHTMSTVAARDGRTVVCVVLGCSRDGKYQDTQTLLDYAFNVL